MMRKRRSENRWRVTPKGTVILTAALSAILLWVNLRFVRNANNLPIDRIASKAATRGINLPNLIARRGDITSPSGGAAACLLVMDDNHLLPEWLAYHYHTLPLRYLVIAIDPRSKTRPDNILNRWSNNTTFNNNMTIVQWNSDADYMTEDEFAQAQEHVRRYFGKHLSPALIQHRARQRLFYYKCMQHCKQKGRHWTALIDTDEYLALGYDTLRRYGRDNLPGIDQPGSVLSFLNQELPRPDAYRNITTPCIQIPRIRFGAKESERLQVEMGAPLGLIGFSFQTLRWRWHASENNYNLNRISKTLIDLERVSWDEVQPIDSIHRPIRSLCGHRKLHIRKSEQALVIHHYLGTYEQYSFRDDARQGKERGEKVRTM